MTARSLDSLAVAFVIAGLAGGLAAHGGRYANVPDRNGRNTPPPNAGGSGRGDPSGRGPGGPSGPTPPTTGPRAPSPLPSPSTPGAGGPTGPGGPRSGARMEVEADEAGWDLWWELHQEPFLQVKRSVWSTAVQTGSDEFFLGGTRRAVASDVRRPTTADIADRIVPALRRGIDDSEQRDVATACMVALAKIGIDGKDWRLVPDVLMPRLRSHDQEVRETAALAIGISGHADVDSVALLVALATDAPAGRAACARAEVDERTRAFACHALGLLAESATAAGIRHRAATALVGLVEDERLSSRNVRCAAVVALGMVDPGPRGTPAANALIDRVVAVLGDYFGRALGRTEEVVQAHCPPAIARLLGTAHPAAAAWRERCCAELEATGPARRSVPIAQSCALALGSLCQPIDGDGDRDAAVGGVLVRTWRDHGDLTTRGFAAMSLARIGGQWTRSALLLAMARANRSIEQPWLAVALGVHAFGRRAGDDGDRAIGDVLLTALRGARNPGSVSALAIGLGLCGHEAAATDLRQVLADSREDEVRGHVAIALALLGHRSAGPELRELLQNSLRRPGLLRQAAVALSVLGDREAVDELVRHLDGDVSLARLAAVASAIGRAGDRRAIDGLVALLGDGDRAALGRAFAAAALGGIADRRPLPWNATLREHVNYRAAVETLQDGAAGILDIL